MSVVPTTITEAQPAASAGRNQAGGVLSSGQSLQHKASAAPRTPLSRISGALLFMPVIRSASNRAKGRQMPAATTQARMPHTTYAKYFGASPASRRKKLKRCTSHRVTPTVTSRVRATLKAIISGVPWTCDVDVT
jgi:hypothetical protein